MTTHPETDEPIGAVVHRLSEQIPELIVTVAVLAAAGITALVGKKQVAQAAPPTPEKAIAGAKQDLEAVKGHQ